MKKLTTFSRALLAIAMMLGVALPTLAHAFEVDGIYYNITDATAKTVAVTYKGSYASSYSNEYTGAVTIPSSVMYNGTTYSVTSIGSSAFSGCSGLTSITIPNSVTSIGSSAFNNCKFLPSVTIPNSVTSIGDRAFYECSNLKLVINLSNLTFSEGSSNYGYVAYYANKVINAPNNSIVGDFVFSKTDNINTLVAYIGNATELILPTDFNGENYKIGDYAFAYRSNIFHVTIPNSVTSIGDYAFYWCSGLTEVNISDLSAWCKIDFGDNAANPLCYAEKFKLNGAEIKDLVIPNDVTEIKDYAFYWCSGLTSITIPNSVTSIGDLAFYQCTGLTEVNYNAENCTSMGSSSYPVFSSCSNLKTLNIGNEVKKIPSYAFFYCRGLTSVTIPNSVTSIGSGAFADCDGLTSVTIPNSVTAIGDYAFAACYGLTEVNISDLSAWCKIDFGDNAANPLCYAEKFKLNGAEIKDLVIPNDVTEIKDYAFYNCSGLTSITIPNSVTSIGDLAFNCYNLRIVKSLSNTPQQCNDNAFGSNPAALLMVPKGSMMSYMIADGWRHFTKIQEFEVDDAVKPVLTIAYPEGGVIKQKVDNGTILELQIVPSNGWKCNSVTFNGVDVTNNLDVDGNYNTPSITADSQLNIVFVKDDGGVESTLANDIKVCVNGNTITILGTDEFADVEIYNTSGINVYNGIEKSITLDANNIYILTVEGRTFKFAM